MLRQAMEGAAASSGSSSDQLQNQHHPSRRKEGEPHERHYHHSSESDALLMSTQPSTTTTTTAIATTRDSSSTYGATATAAAPKTFTPPPPVTAPPPSLSTSDFRTPYQRPQQQEDDDEEDEDDEDDDEEGEYLLEDDDDDDEDEDDDEAAHRPEPILHKGWRLVKECFLVVINVHNLYDEDGMIMTTDNSTTLPYSSSSSSSPTRRNHLVVFFWFCILAMSYGLERSSFKLLVDRAGPFRLFSVLMVTAVHGTILGMAMAVSSMLHHRQRQRGNQSGSYYYQPNIATEGPLGIPLVDVGLMALLDTLQILLVFISARHVPPTFSVILVQFTLPIAALMTQFVRPNGRCGYMFRRHDTESSHQSNVSTSSITATPSPTTTSNTTTHSHHQQQQQHAASSNHMSSHPTINLMTTATSSAIIQPGTPLEGWGGLSAEHLWGSIIISLAVILALCPALYSIFNPDFFTYADPIPLQTAYNTLIYVSSCIPAAASQLYKESVFSHHKQPVDSNHLNLLLSAFQFIIALITAPLVYGLQGLEAKKHWQHVYPPATFSANFWDGSKCFFGLLNEQQALHAYADAAHCKFSFGLVVLHVLSIIVVGVAVDKILQAGATKVMYRGISVGIFVAVLSMYTYDQSIPDYNYGPAMDSITLACLLLLIVGAEVYHRVSLQDAAFETVYAEVENLYAEES